MRESGLENRIVQRKVDIDYRKTHEFFEKRAEKNDVPYLYNKVMYQDDNPEIVLLRDKEEKAKILPKLSIKSSDVVIDIGCGVGRWGEEVLKAGATYIGVDFSKSLLEVAEKNLVRFGKDFLLVNTAFQDLNNKFTHSTINVKPNLAIISGVLIYVNDDDVLLGLKKLLLSCTDDLLIYLREPVSIDDRLTLDKFFSKELKSEYSAIYRSVSEYKLILTECHLKIVDEGFLYSENLNNRSSTCQYYFLLKKD